jgi:hypothetical protein
MSLTRKEFLSTVMNAAAGAAGAALLVACGSGDDDDTGGNCLVAGTSVNISGNHGHTLTVSAGEIMQGTAKTYNIMGTADHDHMVTVSVGAFAMLANNETAMTVSTSGSGHTHNITITCS